MAGYGQANSDLKKIKIVIVGDGAVGKTCMLTSYTTKRFPSEYVPTIFDNYSAVVETMKNGKKERITLMLFDTAGQEDYAQIRPLSYPQTSVFIVCYAVDSRASFMNVKAAWIPEIREHCPNTPWILCGTKADLVPAVTEEEAKRLCAALGGVCAMTCSAMTQKGLKAVFDKAIGLELGNDQSSGGCCIIL